MIYNKIALDYPSVLCKYRNWLNTNHQTIITKRELYLAPPSCFEDVTDCRNDCFEFSEYERKINFQEFDKRCGILSMTKNQDNLELWEKYADHSQGFMVAFEGEILCALFDGSGDVAYYNMLPPIISRKEQSIVEYIYCKYFVKLMQYKREEEFRLVKVNFHVLSENQRKVKIPAEAYKYIKIGKNMPKSFREELINSIPAELKNIPIFQ